MRETYGGSDSLGSILDSSQIVVGENVEKGDLLYLCGLSGKGYAADVTDFAAIGDFVAGTPQTNAATGRIVAQTEIINYSTPAYAGQAVAKIGGYIFTFATNSAGNGAKLTKFSSGGGLLGSVIVDAAASACVDQKIIELSNGDIVVIYRIAGSPQKIKFAIYDINLIEIKAKTEASPQADAAGTYAAIGLSGGGFAVIYQDSVSPLLSKLIIHDNEGTVTLAATTVWTRTGTSDSAYHSAAQLSNGNIAISIKSHNTVSSIGLYYCIWTTLGVQVLAATLLDSADGGNHAPRIAVCDGYFAIAKANGANQKAWVINNAGVIQGSEFSAATTLSTTYNSIAILSDGVDFYLIWHRSSDSKVVLTKLPVSGADYITTVITTTSSQYGYQLSAFYKDGFIVAMSMMTGASPALWVVDTGSLSLVDPAGTSFGVAPGTTTGSMPKLISGGDRAFIAMYDYANVAATNLCVGKWASTAVLGVAVDSAAKNSFVAVQTRSGTYGINEVTGTRSKAFDMSASTTMPGSKGVIVAGGAITIL